MFSYVKLHFLQIKDELKLPCACDNLLMFTTFSKSSIFYVTNKKVSFELSNYLKKKWAKLGLKFEYLNYSFVINMLLIW